MRRIAAALAAVLALGVAAPALATPAPDRGPTSAASDVRAKGPLSGIVIALDPGHQLGNSNPRFRRQLAQTRWNGTIVKGCNTSGTATNSGYPESTFTWKVANRLRVRLEALGATVRMTRSTNSYDAWGPCTWDRGKFGRKVGARLMVSIHADGSAPSGRGFFVIAPGSLKGWTDDIARPSQRLARDLIAGMTKAGATPSTYIRNQLLVWKDQNTLNFSDVPTVIVELGNMRNASEARLMASSSGQKQYADWLLAGIRRNLRR
ncbi:MAG: N-acetylmuramoyl-L-alanine amidase [Candidatus Nanopelagicales bacterium]